MGRMAFQDWNSKHFHGKFCAHNQTVEESRAIIGTFVFVLDAAQRAVVGTLLGDINVQIRKGRPDIACYGIDAIRCMLAVLR